MSKLIKWLLAIVAAVLVVLVLGIVIITAFIDPNSFKPDIEKAAGKQGIALTLGGDLAWQFYPDLGMVVEQVAVAPLALPQQPIASVQKAALSVRLLPLFSGKVAVNGVLLDGVDVRLATDAEGKGNWEALLVKDATVHDKNDEEEQGSNFSLAVHQLTLQNSELTYTDARNQQTVSLRNFVLEGTDIALDNVPFAVHTSGDFVLDDAASNTQTGTFAVTAGIAVTEDMAAMTIKDGNIKLERVGKDIRQSLQTTLQLAVKLPGDKQALGIDVFELADADIALLDNAAQQSVRVSGLQLKAARIILDEKSLPQLAALDMSALSAVMENTASQQKIAVQNLVFSASNIAFNTQAFPIAIKGSLQAEQPDMPGINTGFDVSAQVGIDEQMNVIMLDKARVLATLLGDASQNFDLQTSMRIVLDPLTYSGDIHLAPVDARKAMAAIGQTLPATQLPTAFSRVGIQAVVAGSDNAVRLDQLNLVLDASTFTGSLAVTDIGKQALVVKLRGDQFNADDYMAPVADTAAATESAATGDEPLVPVETLRSLNMDVDVLVDSFTFNKLLFSKLTIMLAAHDGVVDIRRFSGNLYDSPVQLQATVDVRTEKPIVAFDASSKQLPVGRLLRDLDIEERFSGISDVVAKGSSRGTSKNELMQGLDAVIDMSGQQMQLAEINIEKTVCEFIAQAEGRKMTVADWENLTRLRDMTTRVMIKQGVANVQNLEAGVEDIALKTHGIFNFMRGDFDFHLTTRIVEALMTGSHCKVTDKKLLNRDIPIRCKGNLESIGVKTCLPDMSVLEDIAKARLKEETDAAKNKAREKVDQALQQKMGEEGGKAAKELLKGLFKK